MYPMLTRRLQILLDDEGYHRLARRAGERGVSMGSLVREVLDVLYPPVDPRKGAAAEVVLAAEPMTAPRVDELVEDLHRAASLGEEVE